MRTIALVIGHDQIDMGACNYLGEFEFEFNKRIARKIQVKFDRIKQNSIELVVRNKINGKPYFLNEKLIYFLIELHFNSFFKEVEGAEFLVSKNSLLKTSFVGPIVYMHELVVRLLGLKDRGIKRISKGDRGFSNLEYYRTLKCPTVDYACIFEPCFNSMLPGNILIFENEDLYVDILLKAILDIGNGV